MKRKASAVWQGGLRDGKGRLSTPSGVLSDTQYYSAKPGPAEEVVRAIEASGSRASP